MATRSHRISVILSADEFVRFEEYCIEHGFKKSTLIARLIRKHLEDTENSYYPKIRVPKKISEAVKRA